MQDSTISLLLVVAIFATIGFLMAWAASNSRSFTMLRIHRGVSRFGYFLASFLASLLPFVNGTLQPSHANEPFVAVGLIGSMIIAYYATRTQIQWHAKRRSTED